MVFPCHNCKIRGAMIGGGLSMDCFTFARGSHCTIYPASHLYTALIAMRDISRQIITLHLSLCICACVYLYIYVFMYLCICAFVYLHICIFVYLCICVFCICVFVYSTLIAMGDISRQIIIFGMQGDFLAVCGG